MERILDFKEQPVVRGSLFRLLLREFDLGPGPPELSSQTQVNAEKVTAFLVADPSELEQHRSHVLGTWKRSEPMVYKLAKGWRSKHVPENCGVVL